MNSISLRVEKSTFQGYQSYLKIHILPYFGNKYIGFITPQQVQEFVEYLHEDLELSAKSIKNIFSLFHSIMERAIKWHYIKENPCEFVDLPPLSRKESDYYNEKELKKLIVCLESLPAEELKYKVSIELGFLCGLRKSEICGLDWKHVDLKKGTVRIVQKRLIIPGEGVVTGKPKTAKSNRMLALPAPLLADLITLKKRSSSSSVITNDNGEPIYPQVLARWFDRFLKKNGLRHISLHKLRHTYATILAHLDVDIKSVSEQLGHAQATTTLNIYTHQFTEVREDIAKKITKSLYRKPRKTKP